MGNTVLISVVIPVYNAEETLASAVESLLPQMSTDCEIVLVDDGSAQHSAALCDALATQYACVSVVHQLNRGSMAARIRGTREARGRYIAFLDADDIYYENAMALFRRAILDYDADVALFDYDQESGGNTKVKRMKQFDSDEWLVFCSKSKNEVYRVFLDGKMNTVVAGVYRRELLINHADLEALPKIRVGEDRLQKMRILEGAKRIVYGPESCYLYRWCENSQFASVRRNRFVESLYADFRIVWKYESGLYKTMGLSEKTCADYDAKKVQRIGAIVESLLNTRSSEYSIQKQNEYLAMLRQDAMFQALVRPMTIERISAYYRMMVKLLASGRYMALRGYFIICKALKHMKTGVRGMCRRG